MTQQVPPLAEDVLSMCGSNRRENQFSMRLWSLKCICELVNGPTPTNTLTAFSIISGFLKKHLKSKENLVWECDKNWIVKNGSGLDQNTL